MRRYDNPCPLMFRGCKSADPNSLICIKNQALDYYGIGNHAGCVRTFEQEEERIRQAMLDSMRERKIIT